MRKILSPLALALVVLIACSDEKTNPVNNNNNTSTFGGNYYPISIGSSWTYESKVNGISSDYTQTVIGDTNIAGVKYYKVETTGNPNIGLYRKNNDSLVWLDVNGKEFKTLVVGVPHTKWSNRYVESGSGIAYEYEVLDTGLTRTVGNTTYKDVIRVQERYFYVYQGQKDADRDNFMSPEEAMKYGLVDKVLERIPNSILEATTNAAKEKEEEKKKDDNA